LIKINIRNQVALFKTPATPTLPSRKRHVGLFRVFFQIEKKNKKNKNKRSCCSSIIIIIWNDWNLFFSSSTFLAWGLWRLFQTPTRKETQKLFE
jgi:hypothetical protein